MKTRPDPFFLIGAHQRLILGLSRVRMGQSLSCSASAIGMWERGDRDPVVPLVRGYYDRLNWVFAPGIDGPDYAPYMRQKDPIVRAVRAARLARGWSQGEFRSRYGPAPSTISGLESGARGLLLGRAREYLAVVDLRIEYPDRFACGCLVVTWLTAHGAHDLGCPWAESIAGEATP